MTAQAAERREGIIDNAAFYAILSQRITCAGGTKSSFCTDFEAVLIQNFESKLALFALL
jgi:hypothetical protein